MFELVNYLEIFALLAIAHIIDTVILVSVEDSRDRGCLQQCLKEQLSLD